MSTQIPMFGGALPVWADVLIGVLLIISGLLSFTGAVTATPFESTGVSFGLTTAMRWFIIRLPFSSISRALSMNAQRGQE